MDKKLKSSTNNQWTSIPEETDNNTHSCHKNDKTATDNQWTSTNKNHNSQK